MRRPQLMRLPRASKRLKLFTSKMLAKCPAMRPLASCENGGKTSFSPMVVWTAGSMSYARWPNLRMRCAPAMFGSRARGSSGTSTSTNTA